MAEISQRDFALLSGLYDAAVTRGGAHLALAANEVGDAMRLVNEGLAVMPLVFNMPLVLWSLTERGRRLVEDARAGLVQIVPRAAVQSQ